MDGARTPRAAAEPLAASTPVADAILLARVLQREPEALGALYDRYSPLVYAIALHITDDPAAAEATVLAAFTTIWHTAGAYTDDQDVAAWVIGITRYHTATLAQTRAAHPPPRRPSGTPHRRLVGDALALLTAAERAAIEQSYYYGRSALDVAALLEEPVARVKIYLRVGLVKLRDKLLRGGDEPAA